MRITRLWPKRRLHCTASLILWSILCLTSTILLGLAYWQLAKGIDRLAQDQQQALIQQHIATAQQALSVPQSYQQWQKEPTSIQDSQVQLKGTIEPTTLLLHDNRILQGQAGYLVYGVLQLPKAVQTLVKPYQHMLIQVGWSPIPGFDRTIMPQLRFDLAPEDQIKATLEHIHPEVFTLNTAPPQVFSQPAHQLNAITRVLRLQTIDFDGIDQHLQTRLLPFVARATTPLTRPNLRLNTQPVATRGISAAKHFGYSLQWFIFWCIAVGVFLYTQCSWYYPKHHASQKIQ